MRKLTIPFDAGSSLGRGFKRIGSSNPNNIGKHGAVQRVALDHVQATVVKNPDTGVWETITMFPALPKE